jgi:signal transduction histidine kinase
VAAQLEDQGLDLAGLCAAGQYVPLDAAELLSTVMVDGFPERARVIDVIGTLIREASAGDRNVRIFGEMVALLWAEGNYAGALRLEDLWNELGTIHAFALFCAYPARGFGSAEAGDRLRDVCRTHAHVVPAESYNGLSSDAERLRAIVELQQKASVLETEIRIRKQIEQDLRASEAALTRSLQLRDEFLSAISHDLKTPITVLLGQAQLLQRRSSRGTLDEEGLRQGLEHIAARSRMLAELVDELQDVTRLRIGEDLPLDCRPVDLVALVQEVVGGLDGDASAHRIVVKASDEPLVGWWDQVRLRRVVENLLGNAMKYSPVDSDILVTLAADLVPHAKVAVLAVQDHGMGIADDDLPYIFELFYRGKNGVHTVDGMGIGLAGSRHIVEQHGGTITAESQEEAGSVFTVRLPLASPFIAR